MPEYGYVGIVLFITIFFYMNVINSYLNLSISLLSSIM